MIDLWSDRTDLRSSMLDVLWSSSLRPEVLCCLSLRRRRCPLVVVVVSLMTDEVFSFRWSFWFQFLLYHLMNRWTRISGFGFYFLFYFYLFLESMGLLYHLLFFSLDWVCFTNCHLLFRIDVGLFFPGCACFVTFFFFFFFLFRF